MNVRAACAGVLATVIRQQGSLNTVLATATARVAERDRNLLAEICYGTLRHYPALVLISDRLLAKPLKTKDTDVLALVLAGLYQLREMRIPGHAAVHDTVAACKTLKKPWARGLVNGVLRRYLRERETIDGECGRDPAFHHLHPTWLAAEFTAAWGDRAEAIMAANNRRPPMTLRVNRLRVSRDDFLAELAAAGIGARPAPWSCDGVYLDAPREVTSLPGFGEGRVSVQDEAAQLCASLLDLAPGQRVLDACCAPGGKTCHILEHQPALAELVALDLEEERLVRVRENLERLRFTATLIAADAGEPAAWWGGAAFDRILLDAPCSASGVIRRHPDIKLLRRPEDIGKLAATQGRLLAGLWRTLKPGGRLLYATCSILPAENDGVIGSFAEQNSDCRISPIGAEWGFATAAGRQLLPAAEGHDGFYYALLTKTGNTTP